MEGLEFVVVKYNNVFTGWFEGIRGVVAQGDSKAEVYIQLGRLLEKKKQMDKRIARKNRLSTKNDNRGDN